MTRNQRRAGTITILALACLTAGWARAEAPTVRLTDKVLVADVERLGVHFGGDNFYDSVILKQRVAENFEGTIKRVFVYGDAPQPDPNGLYLFNTTDWFEREGYMGADAYVLSGPDQWEKRKVVGLEVRDHATGNRKGKTHFVKLDRPVRWGEDWTNALLLEASDTTVGQDPWIEERRQNEDGRRVWGWEHNKQYITPETTQIVKGDTPPDVGMHASLLLDGGKGESWVKFRVQFWDAAPYAGTWTAKVWAKARDAGARLEVKPTVPGTSATIEPTGEWKHYELKLQVNPKPEGDRNPIFMLQLEARGGGVMIDNVQLSRDGDGTLHPVWRDEIINALKPLKPGSMRLLRNHRDTYINSVVPRIMSESRRGQNRRRGDFGTHEFYQLCQYLGANPWDAISGTILPEDIDAMMEYHGAPADVGYGKLRAELGQEKPWTEVFDKIHIQFGNEVVTFFGTGYWGPDYWESLVKRAKASPYYDPDRFVFHLNEQNGGLSRLFGYHPDFDRGTINGYHIFGVYKDQVERAGDIPGFYDWVFASAWHMWMVEENNKNWSNLQACRRLGKEISIYEGGNYHSTFSTPGDAPMERINRMMAGKAGGVSATNTMLILLKHYGARTQENFNLSQHTFSPGGAFGNLPDRIRGWGGILNIGSDETRRYRPRFLALAVANEVIGGDLVETVHSGDDPTFSVTNRFGAGYGPSRNPTMMTVADVPRLQSYGFRDGDRRGLILVSNNPREAIPVNVAFDGAAAGGRAELWTLKSDGLESTNELDWAADAPEVTIERQTLEGFRSGTQVTVPPGTIVSLEWNVE